jgi:hypothetical protein
MVNIRASLAQANADGVITTKTGKVLEDHAKSLFYQDRTWEALTAEAAEPSIPDTELTALQNWLPGGRIDLKACDARAMLEQMRDLLTTNPEPARVTYAFEWTDMWDTAISGSQFICSDPARSPRNLPVGRLLDELRLDPGAHGRAREHAIARLLALRESARQRLEVDRAAVSAAANKVRSSLGLFSRAAMNEWLAENHLELEEFERLLEEEARIEAVKSDLEPAMEPYFLDHLRMKNEYCRLAERALDKHAVLVAAGLEDPQPGDTGLTPPQLAVWYFEERLGRAMPEDLDGFARALGFAGRPEFYRLIAGEYLFLSKATITDENG